MRYKIVESVNKKENINHPVDDNFTLSEELLNIKSEKINESNNTETNDGLWKEIINILNDENMKFDEGQFGKSGSVFIEFWTDTAGQDVSVGFETDGTPKDFIEKFYEYADNYDVDEELNLYKDYLGENGVPSSLDTLEEDMEEAKETLMTVADRLYEIIQREYRNESLEEDYEYSEYDKKLLINRAKTLAKQISELYNSNQVEAQGELPSENEIAKALLESPQKIDMYAKFLSKIKGTKKVKNYTEKLIQELASFKKKLSLMKPQTSECLMKVRDIKEGKEIDRQVFASLEKLNDGGYSILNDGYFVARVSADDDDDAKAVFKKFLNSDWKKAWKDGTLPKYANDWLEGNVNESLDESSGMRSEYAMDDSQMGDWKQICKAFAKKLGAKLVFVNETSCGLEYPDGSMKHVYIDEMIDYLGGMNESVIPAYATGGYRDTREKNAHRDFFMPEPKDMSDEELKEYLEELIKEVNKKRAELKNESLSRRQLVEKAVPDEDRYENDLIKSIIRKRKDRTNAKLTPEEQEVYNKYNLSIYPDKKQDRYWDNYRHRYVNGDITTDNKTKVGRRFISSRDTWADGAKDGKHDVNYVDMARKAPERIKRENETGIKGNYNQWGLGGSRERYTDATQQLRNKINRDAEKDYRDISKSIYDRNNYKNSMDATDKRFDDEKNRILKRNLEKVTKEIADNENARNRNKEYSQTRYNDAKSEINNILNKHRKNKQESFKRVPKRSINESKVSSSKKNRK